MPRVIVLDTFPLSSTAKAPPPVGKPPTLLDECHRWVEECLRAGHMMLVPAIAYYESLRELERLQAVSQIARLRAFCRSAPGRYMELTDAELNTAAALWARARSAGTPTASAQSLDADAILAAQVLALLPRHPDAVLATTNPGHLAQFVSCQLWNAITP